MKTRLFIVRNGITISNMNGLFIGRTDVELSFSGKQQSQSIKKWFNAHGNPDIIYSSLLKRSISTAEIISNEGQIPIHNSIKLNELDFGDWEGKKQSNIFVQYPESFVKWQSMPHLQNIPNGESILSLQKRVVEEIENIIKTHLGKSLCIVTHEVCIRVLMNYLKKDSIEKLSKSGCFENGSITIVDYSNSKYNVIEENKIDHLEDNLKASTYADIEKLINIHYSNNSSLW